jgi:serine/threonine protein phosphatase PrpC
MAVPWRIATASVRGANHARANVPNQDALCQLPIIGEGWPFVAVSDGHGSAKSFRSEIGAILAVASAMVVAPKLLSDPATAQPEVLKNCLPQQIVEVWRNGVEGHMHEQPFTDAEWSCLVESSGDKARAEVEANPWLAYGATLLLCAIRPGYIICAQLGDGDILLVTERGEVSRPHWPADQRLIANETTSLCMAGAWREMRVDVQVIPEQDSGTANSAPELILLATDGYANSFANDAGFRRVGSDLLEMIRSEGLDLIASALPAWLDESSRLGSGDDISVALLYRDGGRLESSLRVAPVKSIEALA